MVIHAFSLANRVVIIAQIKTYFDNIRATMASIAALADEYTFIVQMVGFSNPKWQLPRYLETMEEIGLSSMAKATGVCGAAYRASAGISTNVAIRLARGKSYSYTCNGGRRGRGREGR